MQRRVYAVHKGAFDKQLWCSDVRLQDVWTLSRLIAFVCVLTPWCRTLLENSIFDWLERVDFKCWLQHSDL
jgi:hypothetical protein